MRRQRKTVLASALMLSCIGASTGISSEQHWFKEVTDQALRENLTEFTQRCFYVPYVLMNIAGRKQDAMEAKSAIEFVKAHPHPTVGIYWQDEKGSKTYLSCKSAVEILDKKLKSMSQEEVVKIEEVFKQLQIGKRG